MSLKGRAIMRERYERERAQRIMEGRERRRMERLPRWCPQHGPLLYGTRCLTCERNWQEAGLRSLPTGISGENDGSKD